MPTQPIPAAPSRAGVLPLVGGALCLDFANTASGRGGDHHRENLGSYELLLVWCAHAGVFDAREKRRLGALARRRPAAAARTLRRALRLREAIHAVAVAASRAARPPAAAVLALNRELGRAMARTRLEPAKRGFVWRWGAAHPSLDAMFDPILRSAAELLTRQPHSRLKQCPGRHCGWVFLDRTKNRRRRWCEMQVCGSRAKARAYRARRRSRRRRAG
jgi:predicted RNA-binding Zn ribbon-like protein